MAVLLGLASATAYGVASNLQHREALHVQASNPLAPGLLVSLAKRPAWLLALGADISAVALQGAALRFGAVVLVQLLVVAGLPIAVLLSSLPPGSRLSRRDLLGLVLCTGGLVLAVPATTGVNLGHPAGPGAWTPAIAVVVAATLALVGLARARPSCGPVALGVAAGITAGASSVLLAVCAAGIDHPVHLLSSAAPYGAVVGALTTLSLTQSAFQTGAIGAPLAALSITEPAAAVVLALAVLHQHLPSAPSALVPAGIGAVVAVGGVVLLAHVSSAASPADPLVVEGNGRVGGKG
ncbi:MAG: hypothetical protein NVS3B26_04790 [Mycobacteriales bacterium]